MKKRNTPGEKISVRRPCIRILKQLEAYGAFSHFDLFYWICPPDYGKVTLPQAKSLKEDGYHKGVFDLNIIACKKDVTQVYLVEFKYKNNGYTSEQKEIADKAKKTDIVTVKIYSAEEFQKFLFDRKLIDTNKFHL